MSPIVRVLIVSVIIVAGALAAEPLPEPPPADLPPPEPWVIVELTDGRRMEGIVREETAYEVVLQVERAGGTIITTERLLRTNIVSLVPLSDAELAARSERRAWEQVRRYRLHPQSSFPADYYQQVIEGVFRPFLQRYPNSEHADEVAALIAQWQEELRRVKAGQVKYRGEWLPAAEAAARMEREQGEQLLAQARALAARGQYAQAIRTVEMLPGPEAKAFLAATYPQWLNQLERETDRLESEIGRVQQTLQTAEETRQRLQQGINNRGAPSLRTWEGSRGSASSQDIFELNRANQTIRTASNQLVQLQARLTAAQREWERAQAGARRVAVPLEKASDVAKPGRVVDEPQADLGSGRAPREMDYTYRDLLAQMAGFFREYWVLTALVAVVLVWIVSRRLSR